MNRRAMGGLVGLLGASMCVAADATVEETLQARWTAAYNSGDAASLGAMYATDARLQQGYCPVVAGREAIEEFWRGDLGDGTTKTYLELEDSLSLDGVLYVSGSYAVEIPATDSAAARRTGGTYSQIWGHEERTGWTIHRETWSNLACADIVVEPPPSAAPEPTTSI